MCRWSLYNTSKTCTHVRTFDHNRTLTSTRIICGCLSLPQPGTETTNTSQRTGFSHYLHISHTIVLAHTHTHTNSCSCLWLTATRCAPYHGIRHTLASQLEPFRNFRLPLTHSSLQETGKLYAVKCFQKNKLKKIDKEVGRHPHPSLHLYIYIIYMYIDR